MDMFKYCGRHFSCFACLFLFCKAVIFYFLTSLLFCTFSYMRTFQPEWSFVCMVIYLLVCHANDDFGDVYQENE